MNNRRFLFQLRPRIWPLLIERGGPLVLTLTALNVFQRTRLYRRPMIWLLYPPPSLPQSRVRHIHNFFYSLRSESKRIWISFTLFACFGIFANTIYSPHLLFIRYKIFAQICIQIFDLMQKIHVEANIRFRANICFTFAHTSECLLQNNRFCLGETDS